MKILLDGTVLVKGGALQACLSFVLEAVTDAEIDWYFVISQEMASQLEAAGFDVDRNSQFHILPSSPSRSFSSRKQLAALEKRIGPNAVFSFFGPTYVRFSSTHFMGFANPWVTHPNQYALNSRASLTKRILASIKVWYNKLWLKRADYWIVEAEIAKKGVMRIVSVPDYRVAVVSNGCRNELRCIKSQQNSFDGHQTINILCITAYYPHKNLEIIPRVAQLIKAMGRDIAFKFILTLPEDLTETKRIFEEARILGVEENIETMGVVPVAEVVDLYKKCHLAFIPTLLETFSATIPEAMAAGLPVVATDFDFSSDIGKDAALYFSPECPAIAAKHIVEVIENISQRKKMIARGLELVSTLPDAKEKYLGYKKFILKNI